MKKYALIGMITLLAAVAVAATIVGSRGTFTTTVTGTRISTTYTPAFMAPACSNIYMAQTCRDEDQNGNIIKPKDYQGNHFEHLQDDMTPGGTYIDHVVCEKDPYYNGEDEGKDTNSAGFQSESIVIPTTMSDRPYYSDGIFPDGVTTITSTFEVCAICKDDGRVLDCFTWTYTRTKGSGNNGTTVSGTTAQEPSAEFKAAKTNFETNHLFGVLCPEELAEAHVGLCDPEITPPITDPHYPIPGVPFGWTWGCCNGGGADALDVPYVFTVDGMVQQQGTIPVIPYFDCVFLNLEVPALAPGVHTFTLELDPDNVIEEIHEENNFGLAELELVEGSAVPEGPAPGRLAMEMVRPNPTHGRFDVLLRLGSASPARLAVYDVRGRVVQSRTIQGSAEVLRTESFHLSSHLGAGVYFVRVEQDGFLVTRKFIMLK